MSFNKNRGGRVLAKGNRNVRNNRKKSTGKFRPLVSLIIIILLIVLAFYLLEKIRKPVVEKPAEKPPVVVHKVPPAKVPEIPPVKIVKPHVIQKHYTTAAKLPHPVRPPERITPIGQGTVAIIIDDMGSSMQEVKSLMAINAPLTFSIIPGLGKGREVAEAAHSRNYEVMLHMPMEPKDYPQRRLEKNGLLMAESDEEIDRQVNEYLKVIPYTVGANNHMGSRFTENEPKMQDVLQVLKGRGMFFIDSVTTPHSVGLKLAREMGVRTAARNVFLDNVQDVAAIRKQIQQLAQLAVKRGSAIGICHPHPATIQALAEELPVLQKAGIKFVYASELVK
jgi:polysaccharide deacetylase 2 family uncharacterized protein YibQ